MNKGASPRVRGKAKGMVLTVGGGNGAGRVGSRVQGKSDPVQSRSGWVGSCDVWGIVAIPPSTDHGLNKKFCQRFEDFMFAHI